MHWELVKPLLICAAVIFGIKYGVKFFGVLKNGIKRKH
jgi:hypothetical protein